MQSVRNLPGMEMSLVLLSGEQKWGVIAFLPRECAGLVWVMGMQASPQIPWIMCVSKIPFAQWKENLKGKLK